jgi:hypothetical protein
MMMMIKGMRRRIVRKRRVLMTWTILETVWIWTRVLAETQGGTTLGDGSDTLFWQDRWLHGQRIADLAPRLLAAVPKDRINKCTVQEALCANKWVSDIRGAITVGVMVEYLQLWEVLLNVELQPGHQDTHFWRFTANKRYSAKVAYEGLFWGSVEFEHYEQVW